MPDYPDGHRNDPMPQDFDEACSWIDEMRAELAALKPKGHVCDDGVPQRFPMSGCTACNPRPLGGTDDDDPAILRAERDLALRQHNHLVERGLKEKLDLHCMMDKMQGELSALRMMEPWWKTKGTERADVAEGIQVYRRAWGREMRRRDEAVERADLAEQRLEEAYKSIEDAAESLAAMEEREDAAAVYSSIERIKAMSPSTAAVPPEGGCESCGCPECDNVDCIADECMRCTGEYCDEHLLEPCECDVDVRHGPGPGSNAQ